MSEQTPEEYAALIRAEQGVIDGSEGRINEIAKQGIPEFHFLTHKVSTFWTCDQSPIGMCVWDTDSPRGFHIDCNCRYCGDPVERK